MFFTDGSYKEDLKQYTEKIVEEYGVSSNSSEREIVCMSKEGNVVALKLYADMLFYKKIYDKHAYKKSFYLYLQSADIDIEGEKWKCGGKSYPLAFWSVGYYLVNYKRESVLKKCETIDEIEAMTLRERMKTALDLSYACLKYEKNSGAINLVGRILREASLDEELFEDIRDMLNKKLLKLTLPELTDRPDEISSTKQCADFAEILFITSAQKGYPFACNNLAAREADKILKMDESTDLEAINECIINYICYLKLAADRYEPYAANRLGLFYMKGEVSTSEGKKYFKEYVDTALAKEYFFKATEYPDSNSAWGYFNLMKYFTKMYEKDIDLMNEHMDYIKQLNPAVYDLAMDL